MFIVGDPNLFSLKFNTYHFNAGNGRHGGSKFTYLFSCCVVVVAVVFIMHPYVEVRPVG